MLGPWERRKPPEYYSASDFEKLQWACGIPCRFWNTGVASIRPSTFKYTGHDGNSMESIAASVQKKYFAGRLEQPDLLEMNRIVCITSKPSDDYALSAACLLATAAIKHAWAADDLPRIRVDDIQDYEKSIARKKEFYSASPNMLVLYNFNPNSSKERLALAKDLLNSFEGAYRVIVAAAENPFDFARNHLYMEPHEAYHFEGKPRKVLQV
jgi:hypothetical protein